MNRLEHLSTWLLYRDHLVNEFVTAYEEGEAEQWELEAAAQLVRLTNWWVARLEAEGLGL
jgi:hypothetical protein